jgi:hypothetical protein
VTIEKATACILATLAALYAVASIVGHVLPETSRVGQLARRIALDLRGRP